MQSSKSSYSISQTVSKSIDLTQSRIFFETPYYIVYYKASGLPSAPLQKIDEADLYNESYEGEHSALRVVAQHAPGVLKVQARYKSIEGGLIHRIDTPTSGLLLFAKTQTAYDYFMREQDEERFYKTYTAFCKTLSEAEKADILKNGYPPLPRESSQNVPLELSSYFRNYGPKGASVRPLLSVGKKRMEQRLYTTRIELIEGLDCERKKCNATDFERKKCLKKIIVSVRRAYRHQVRSHLLWLGYPIIGDERYGNVEHKHDFQKSPMLFFASDLSFIDPETQEYVSYVIEDTDLVDFARNVCSSATR